MHLPFRESGRRSPGTVPARSMDRAGDGSNPDVRQRTSRAGSPIRKTAVDRYGRYPYSYEAMGLSRDFIEDLFADYSKRFGLE